MTIFKKIKGAKIMSTTEITNSVWHIKLDPYHFHFFKELAKEAGNTERGCEARECRKFLNEKIVEHKTKKVDE